MLVYYLLTFLLGGTAYNLLFLILSIIGIIRAKKHKSYKWCFITGFILTMLAIIGSVVGGEALTEEQFLYSLYTVILMAITIPRAKKLYNESGENSIRE